MATAELPTTQEQIERFKARFRQDLQNFLATRKDDIGEPSQWKIASISIPSKSSPYIAFKSISSRISFHLHDLPHSLHAKHALSLKKFINSECANAGFQPHKTRIAPLSSQTIENVKKGDPQAINAFVEKHYDRWIRYAQNALAHGNNSILEPEDVVTMALEIMIEKLKQEGLGNEHPVSWMNRAIGQVAERGSVDGCLATKGGGRAYRESDSRLVRKHTRHVRQQEYDPKNHETLARVQRLVKYRLPELCAAADLTEKQQKALDIIFSNHEGQLERLKADGQAGYYMLAVEEIGRKMAPHKRNSVLKTATRQNLAIHITNIATKLEIVAYTLAANDPEGDFKALVEYIKGLTKQIKRGREI